VSDEPDNPVLRQLRRMDEKIDRLGDDLRDINQRLTTLAAAKAGHDAATLSRLDRMEVRLDRIERRPALAETHA